MMCPGVYLFVLLNLGFSVSLEPISVYSKIERYKANVQKLITFLYISNEQVGFWIKNTIPFTLVTP